MSQGNYNANVIKDIKWSDLMVHIHLTQQVTQSATAVEEVLKKDIIAKIALTIIVIHVLKREI